MKAVCLHKPNGKLEIEERPRLSPRPGELLLRVHACGICHGDIMMRLGAFPFVHFPIVPGHEIAGVVEEVGSGVKVWKPGARAGLSVLYCSCGSCAQCARVAENLCPVWEWTGMMHDGGYAEFVIARADYAVPLPDELTDIEVAPLMCAGVTVYSGLIHSGVRPGQRVAIVGLGGLGHLAVLYARAIGTRVAVVSTHQGKEKEAKQLGAERFIVSSDGNPAEKLRDWDGGADVIVATAPTVESVSTTFGGLAADGTMVVLGVGPGRIEIDPTEIVMGRRRVMGSPAGSRSELRETLRVAVEHGIRPRVTTFPLTRVADAFAAVERGDIAGRAVLIPTA
jgi:propanol-preferring alcohol dehydrogenase